MLLLLFLSAIACACARLPDLGDLQPPPASAPAAGGPARRLRPSQVDAALRARLEEEVTGRPLIEGNKVTLLFDGPRTLAAMGAAVAAAQDTVHLETYLFDQDEVGMKFADLLIAKQKEGVQVSIIYDCVGTIGTPQAFFDRMKAAGIRLLPFHPVNPLARLGRWRINQRDHRKILVVDGRVAFTGGVNLAAAYSRSSLFRSRTKGTGMPGWRDTHLQIEGPAVAALQWMFLDNWASQKGEELPERDYFPALAPAGDKAVRVLRGQPGSNLEIFKAYLLAIRQAKASVHIASAYFVPDAQILGALLDAAARGVDVKVILPSVSDNWLTSRGARSYYERMLKGGIRVFELKEAVLHAKTAVIDGTWSTVGSTNLDVRSFLHNREVNVVVIGEGFGREMEAAFQDDLKGSREIALEAWKERPRSQRVGEWFARLFAYWL